MKSPGSGRKPQPKALVDLKATGRASRQYGVSDDAELISKIEPPKVLNARAKIIFAERAEMLIAQRQLTQADVDYIVTYSETLDKYYTAIEMIEKTGGQVYLNKGGEMVMNPWMKAKREAVEIMLKIGAQFGFSPSTRLVTRAIHTQMSPLQKMIEELKK